MDIAKHNDKIVLKGLTSDTRRGDKVKGEEGVTWSVKALGKSAGQLS